MGKIMGNFRPLYLLAILAISVSVAPAQALDPITYVSGNGSDSNACTLAAPCRNFARAISMVAANGTIRALDSASYGNTTISRSLTIDGGGNVVALGTRITINRADAVVTLRGLVMDGRKLGSGLTGISVLDALAVHIEDCEIGRYTGSGISFVAPGSAGLYVSATVLRENATGLYLESDYAFASIEDSSAENNTGTGFALDVRSVSVVRSSAVKNFYGFYVQSGVADITDARAIGNDDAGFFAYAGAAAILSSSVSRDNKYGLYVYSSAAVTLINNVFMGNSLESIHNLGTVYTRQNNTVTGAPVGSAPSVLTAY